MQITPADLSALIGAIVALALALAAYLNSRTAKKDAKAASAKVDAVLPRADGHNQPPMPHG